MRPPLSPPSASHNVTAATSPPPSSARLASPCKHPNNLRKPSPDGDATANVPSPSTVPDQAILQADLCFSSQGIDDVIALLESHLDPMLHEASV